MGELDIDKMTARGDVKGLIKALKYEDLYVRASAALALREIGDARAVEPLTKALKDEYKHVREAAAEALQKIKAKAS